jgi:polysaccharide biosynthesis transport protein
MSLREYLQVLRDGKWWIAAGLLFGMLAGQLIALNSVPSYVASTTLYFSAIEGGGEPGQAYQGAMLAEQKARAYAQLIVSDRVLNEVAGDTTGSCESGCGPVALDAVTVESSAGNPTLIVKVADSSPERAAMVANTLAEKTANLVGELERPRNPRISTVTTLRVVAPAVVPTTPVSPNLKLDVLVGAVVGAFLGLSAAVIRRNLDKSVRTRGALEELTGLPLLATIPDGKRAPGLIADHPTGQVAEAVRQLRVNLRSAGMGSSRTSLLVTSAVTGEDTTTLACNLATAFRFEGDRVLLIDANLRHPGVGSTLGMDPPFGLSTVLHGERQLHEVVQTWHGLFDVLTSGPLPGNPSELLSSVDLVLTEVESRYDVVLIDSPALLPVADASVLARACDGALLIVRHGRTSTFEITEALAALRVVSACVLGCAFTGGPRQQRSLPATASRTRGRSQRPDGLGDGRIHPYPDGQDGNPVHHYAAPSGPLDNGQVSEETKRPDPVLPT